MKKIKITNYNINWNIPDNIGFLISSNESGYSSGKFKHANFSYSVGDDRLTVRANIESVKESNKIDYICFMRQTHSNKVRKIIEYDSNINCDAIFTLNKEISCAVLTADCVPILVTDITGTIIGCIHAGWKGLRSNIIENFFNTISNIKISNFKVLIGPCISKNRYEVKDDVFSSFPRHAKYFTKIKSNKYNMDIRLIAYDIITKLGITDVTISKSCTYDDKLYSYRKNNITGRFISLIWFKK
tara:strand:+ start:9511 stop:10239 length:729 start_codon:yes stop_codon:yes gene_type:complete